jgi:hypothetical protein
MGSETALMSMGADGVQKLASTPIRAATTIMSFAQASKQKKKQREAEAKAAQAMTEARKRLEVNFAENRSIQKEPYELAREAILSSGAQALQQGVESDRGAEVTAGKVQMAMNQGQADIRTAMGQEMTDIEKDIINEDARLADLGMQLNLEEAAGAQLAARDAEEARAAAITQGFQGLESVGQQSLEMVPLFQQNNADQKTALGKMSLTGDEFQQIGNIQGKKGGVSKSMGAAGTGQFTNLDLEKIGNMSKKEFRQFKRELSPYQRQMLFSNPQYQSDYNAFNPFQ